MPLGAKQFVGKMLAKQRPSKGAFEDQKREVFGKGLIIARREELFNNTKTNGGKPKVLAPSVM